MNLRLLSRRFGLSTSPRSALLVAALAAAGTVASACGDDVGVDPPGVDGGTTPEGGTQDEASVPPAAPTRFSRPSHGSVIDLSEDDALLVVVNRDVGTVSVFDVAYPEGAPPTVTKRAEVPVGAEPREIALSPSGDQAYVILKKDQKLVRLDGLRTNPVRGPEVAVGSEPTGLALTPKGRAAWVANWVDGTLTEVDTATMKAVGTVDLNGPLAATGVLGAGVTGRPSLAHPRSITITNNKDDLENDEAIFVTEYYGQFKETLAANGSNADVAKQGFVYRVGVADKQVRTIPLPPIADIGIKDHNGAAAGCYPNQLQNINVTGSFAYVLSICASPKGPLGDYLGPNKAACTLDATCPGAAAGACDLVTSTCKTNCTSDDQCGLGGKCTANTCEENLVDAASLQTPAVSVIDIGANRVIASVSLNGEFQKMFAAKNVPDTTARRFPLHVTDIGFVPGTLNAYLPANGSDAVYRVDFNASYETKAVDAVGTLTPFTALDRGTLDASRRGKLPLGITIGHKAKVDSPTRFAFVANEASRNVTVLDLKTDDIAGGTEAPAVVASTAMPSDAAGIAELEGKHLFNTGLGRWSWRGQAWGACSSCHWEGLSDQVTWFHRRGARQSPSIDQTVSNKDPNEIRAMNWQASSDELADNENGALRVVLGGVGAIVKNLELDNAARIPFDRYGHSGLSGSITTAADPQAPVALVGEVCVLDDWKKIDVYEKRLRTPRRPTTLDAAKVDRGKALFAEANCQGCHGGDKWTLSKVFYTPDADTVPATNTNKVLRTSSWTAAVQTAGFPAALLPTALPAAQTMRYNGNAASNFDSLTCLLRNVGTFNVAEPGVGISELRRNMSTAAQGNEDFGKGYNVPSLLGMTVAAPYLHAGQVRTLEALLSSTFASHTAALKAGFLADSDADAVAKREALVQYLLSIDEDTPAVPVPALGPTGGDFCVKP